MTKKETAAPLRVDLYIRVSGQEQTIKGLSLEAQQEDLEECAKERGWVIVGTYIDAAKTARKRMYKRTNFLRMLEDVKQDTAVFTHGHFASLRSVFWMDKHVRVPRK